MATKPNVIIDPVTRIEGHLRIQAYATPGTPYPDPKDSTKTLTPGLVESPALSASTMVRGVEQILQGRDPRDAWAFTQRICGVCTVVHGLTSVRAVENAINIKVPRNADYIRNMMIGAQYVHDHVMHFYHLHALDWVDVLSALSADPVKTAALAVKNNPSYKPDGVNLPNAAYFQAKLDALKSGFGRGQLGLFANGYWGHSAYKLTPEENLLLVTHYLEALAWARQIVKLHTIFGGKDPHPNLVVGGMPCTLSANTGTITKDAGGTALNTAGLAAIKKAVDQGKAFVDQVYLPDVVLVASRYPEWANFGATAGDFLSFGEFPDPALGQNTGFTSGAIDFPDKYVFPQAVLRGWTATPGTPLPTALTAFKETLVTENVAHAWYVGSSTGEHPSKSKTILNYTGPKPDQANPDDYMLDQSAAYSWIKSPRYEGKPVEVGPLAHILIMYVRAGTPKALDTDRLVRYYVDTYWKGKLGLSLNLLNSTLGRIFARMLETKIIADQMAGRAATSTPKTAAYKGWYQLYYDNRSASYWNPKAFSVLANPTTLPDKVGFGYTEAPRGALGHWVKIDRTNGATSGRIDNYQCIVASQWNAGPRDNLDQPGPYEQSLKGHKLADITKPLEILRTIHSFDPCIGCAVHIVDPDGKSLVEVDINHAYR
jgi:hydrogenase large subunit